MIARCRRCGGSLYRAEADEYACLQCGARRYAQEPDRRPPPKLTGGGAGYSIGGARMREGIRDRGDHLKRYRVKVR